MDRKRYPKDWQRIAFEVKAAAGWRCQECGKQCRKPGDPFDTHKRTLTVAHLNHIPEDVRPENLKALCAPCHLRYDARHHAETRKEKHIRSARELEENRTIRNFRIVRGMKEGEDETDG